MILAPKWKDHLMSDFTSLPCPSRLVFALIAVSLAQPFGFALGGVIDLSNAVLVIPQQRGALQRKAVEVLQQEVQRRTGIHLPTTHEWPADGRPAIAIALQSQQQEIGGPLLAELSAPMSLRAEGFLLSARRTPRPAVIVLGCDPRGVWYGVGRLLRKARLTEGSITVPDDIDVTTAPRYPLRGHQLGYRPKTNAYDAWSPAQYDQYIRELALFGANSIEIVPPRTDDDPSSPHMQVPPREMMIRLSEIIDSYGMDVWIWYPNMGDDYVTEDAIRQELNERAEIFRSLKRIDHILVPGGDPGDLHPDVLFPWLARMAAKLAEYHPQAKLWVSPQATQPTRAWLASFYAHVNQKPNWLGGIAFAPWVKTPLPELRRIVAAEIPLRRYPDITHNVACQYPVRDWDLAFALTLHRECYNPRPRAIKAVHNAFDEYACGAITYSEGINDDVNKFIWSDQDWDPSTPVIDTLRDYARLLIASDYADEIAQGLMAAEANWEGPLAANDQVGTTLEQWCALDSRLPARARNNYRFQMGLLRACYDAYIQRRLLHETCCENAALDELRRAPQLGAVAALDRAEAALERAEKESVAPELKQRCTQLADALFASIGSQLTVVKHGAKDRSRGAFMDGIDEPLNNKVWLLAQFERVRQASTEQQRLDLISQIVNRTNPGPGGFYDDMGSFSSLKRIVNDLPWAQDPGTLRSARVAFGYQIGQSEDDRVPLAWKNHACTLYETPLQLRYEHLDPAASYHVRVTYTGRIGDVLRLTADDQYEVHGLIKTRVPPIREFPVPREATNDGQLLLTWTCGEGQRGCQVAEIWLIKD
ncbi:MAG: hypothetical protein A2W31_11720 [Planctomycetes bacterium RBG_16_64_10]|nr:MAG: hypothetical protein A2W31_11720 [Planctomycetes bacterium RBG_16_64_10]